MKTILLATNLGPMSRFALKRALLLARRRNAALHVLHVTDRVADTLEDPLGQHVDEVVEWLERELEDDFGAGFRPASIGRIAGSPAAAIVAKSEAIGADLLVVGLTERPAGDRFLEGTILERLLLLTPTPLLVARTEPKGCYEKALVGLDLGPTSRRALETALKVAPTADFLIVHANEADVSDSGLHDKINNVAQHCFAAARRAVGFLEGAIEIRVETGSVGGAMQRNARRFNPDLVAFGKHNKGVSAGPHLGTGARAILENLDTDMLVTMSVAT